MRKSNPILESTDLLGNGEKGMIYDVLWKKLQAVLLSGWQSEAKVVYFLVLLRKLVEGFGDPNEYDTASAKFFCDWALHPLLDRGATVAQLRRFDEALDTASREEFFAELEHTFKLEHLREDLIHQLILHQLPTDPIRTMNPWIDFLRLYLAVVTDSPILERREKLNHIDRLDIAVEERAPAELPQGSAYVFTIVWTFRKRRKVVLEWRNQLVSPLDPKPGVFYHLHGPRVK